MTTHLFLVPRLRMHESVPPLPKYVLMAWCLIKQWIQMEVKRVYVWDNRSSLAVLKFFDTFEVFILKAYNLFCVDI
jgi:hypothetical protein